MHRWGVFVTVMVLSGCAVEKEYIKAFDGADVPDTRKALLKPAEGIIIHAIDGKSAGGIQATQSMKIVDYDIALLPGSHNLVVSYYDGNLRSYTNNTLKLDAGAGHRYLIRGLISNYGTVGGNITYKISDVSDRPACWTVEKLKRPRDC